MSSPMCDTMLQESTINTSVVDNKIDKLEKVFKSFRAEVDMKFKILQQILTSRDEQVVVRKELLEREHTLHKNLLGHWRNTSVLAASGLSLNFSSKNIEEVDFLQQSDLYDEDYSNDLGMADGDPSTSITKSSRSRKRRKRSGRVGTVQLRDQKISDSDTDESNEKHEFMEVAVNPDEGSDCESDRIAVGKKVYIEFSKGIVNNSGNSVWLNFLRESNGQSALCKLCDKAGIQKILKTVGGSTSGLHNHLKSLHRDELNLTSVPENREKRNSSQQLSSNKAKHVTDRNTRLGTVWDYFEKVQTSDGNSSQCKLCEKDGTEKLFKAQKGGSTTGLHRHLLRVHNINLRSREQLDEKEGETEPDDPVNYLPTDSNKLVDPDQALAELHHSKPKLEHTQRPSTTPDSEHQIIPVGTHTEWGPYQHVWQP